MFTSITDTNPAEAPVKSSPPWVWIGFLFAGAFFMIEVLFVILELEESAINGVLTLLMVGGWIYWLICVHRIHKILAELTRNRYPISPGEGSLKHIIPFYNLVWVFKWPAELSDYINRHGRVKMISGYAIGGMLLFSLLLRMVDGAFGMAFIFGVTMYVSNKVKKHVKAGQGITEDLLPPLPDPNIFSRPIETATVPVQQVAEGPGS
jgi:hypothetical protein